MLIRLRLENLYSFKAAEFSMVASSERIHPHHIHPARTRNDVRLARFAAIYGANAAGKSNLVRALGFAQDLVLRGLKPEAKIPVERFRLDPAYRHRPATIALEFKLGQILYEYGFECDSTRVHREWLSTFTRKTEQLLFERHTPPEGKTQIKLGDFAKKLSEDDKKFLEFVARGTRPNQLYIHECIERNVETFAAPYHWFRHILTIVTPDSHPLFIEFELQENETIQTFFSKILNAADTGIHRIITQQVDWDSPEGEWIKALWQDELTRNSDEMVYLHLQSGMRFTIVNKADGTEPILLKLVTTHLSSDGEEMFFDIYEESDGTKRLIDLIPIVHELVYSDEERVFVVDEIGRSLHPQLVRILVELHLRADNQTHPSQLVTTTHETHLLDLDLLRRDEVWFAEKQPDGATDLYSLYDFQPRYDKNVLQDYLQGRYGAIPFLGNARALKLH
ncbi:MAG: ATP-binding protein [Leptolyngbya sp.]|nr:ATP-binding protein [Leptolyngbya sp.]